MMDMGWTWMDMASALELGCAEGTGAIEILNIHSL